jgi:rhodanese-related sulfurtransferase
VLDVREPHEYPIANLGAPLIPVGSLESRIAELAAEKTQPRSSSTAAPAQVRSQKAALILIQRKKHGFTNVSNLTGGILAWADKIDPSHPCPSTRLDTGTKPLPQTNGYPPQDGQQRPHDQVTNP